MIFFMKNKWLSISKSQLHLQNLQRSIGIAQVILSGACFGLLGYFGKIAYSKNIEPGELLALRYSISSIIMLLLILFIQPKLLKISFRQIVISCFLGVFGYALFSSFYFYALTGVSASLTVLLLYTYPTMIMLISAIFLKRTITRTNLMALAISFLGLLILLNGELKFSHPKFIVFGLLSAFFYSLYILASEKLLKSTNAISSSFYVQLGAGSVLSLIHFQDFYRPFALLILNDHIIVPMAFICSCLAMSLFLLGLKKVSASETSILSTTEPFFGVIFASLLLNEQLTLAKIAGGLLIIVSVCIMSLTKNSQ